MYFRHFFCYFVNVIIVTVRQIILHEKIICGKMDLFYANGTAQSVIMKSEIS